MEVGNWEFLSAGDPDEFAAAGARKREAQVGFKRDVTAGPKLGAGGAHRSIAELHGRDLQRAAGMRIGHRPWGSRMTGKRARTLLGAVPHEKTVKEIGTEFRQSRGSLPHPFRSREPEPSVGVQARSPVLGCNDAKVAELADAPDLGSGTRKGMGVRVPPFAPFDSGASRPRSGQAA